MKEFFQFPHEVDLAALLDAWPADWSLQESCGNSFGRAPLHPTTLPDASDWTTWSIYDWKVDRLPAAPVHEVQFFHMPDEKWVDYSEVGFYAYRGKWQVMVTFPTGRLVLNAGDDLYEGLCLVRAYWNDLTGLN